MDSALRGLLGELKTLARLSVGKTDLSLQCISNFPIKGDNTYYQVDAIIVCTKGVFCLEVKNWSCILIVILAVTGWQDIQLRISQ